MRAEPSARSSPLAVFDVGIKLTSGLVIVAGLAALIWQFPAQPIFKKFAGDRLGPQAAATGTLWRGQITGAQGFGPITYRLRPLRALTGDAPLQAETGLPGINMRGRAGRSGFKDVSITGRVWTFSNVDPRLTGLRGNFSVIIDTLLFDAGDPSGGCTDASGSARTDILKANAQSWSWTGPDLAGPIRCEDGALVLALEGDDAGQTVNMTLRAFPDGRYNSTVSVKTRDSAAQNVMALFGFEARGGVYTLSETGRWQ